MTVICVDRKFFENIFEKERIKLMNELGLNKLSQQKFTRMIKSLEIMRVKR